MASQVKCLLWDFGDTLCDERFIWSSSSEWQRVYESFDGGWGDAWFLGEMNSQEFAREASRYIDLEPDAIVAHMRKCCENIRFFEFTYAFYRARHLPQAIVTVNPDLWTETIVPLYGFDSTADVIVSSWEEKSLDKGHLCQVAVERLPVDAEAGECLLIDNKRANIAAWEKRGGRGYLYTTDAAFRRDLEGGLPALPRD